MTHQELFDTCMEQLIKQGGPSRSESNVCKYLSKNGTKCAVGILLKEDEYSPKMEFISVQGLVANRLLPKRLIPYKELLLELQNVHDRINWSPSDMEEFADFQVVAHKFDLQWKFNDAKIQRVLSS